MSHFLCGEISFGAISKLADSQYAARLLRLIGAGTQCGLCVQFGANIAQKTVFEILGYERDEINFHPAAFVVLGPPPSNTSDELFYPCSSELSPDERIDYLKNRIEAIVSWVGVVFGEAGAVEMSVYLSEGYDVSYDEKKCSLRDFPSIFQQTLCQTDFVPSTRFSITPTQ